MHFYFIIVLTMIATDFGISPKGSTPPKIVRDAARAAEEIGKGGLDLAPSLSQVNDAVEAVGKGVGSVVESITKFLVVAFFVFIAAPVFLVAWAGQSRYKRQDKEKEEMEKKRVDRAVKKSSRINWPGKNKSAEPPSAPVP